MRTETDQLRWHDLGDNLRWCALAALGAALYVATVGWLGVAVQNALGY